MVCKQKTSHHDYITGRQEKKEKQQGGKRKEQKKGKQQGLRSKRRQFEDLEVNGGLLTRSRDETNPLQHDLDLSDVRLATQGRLYHQVGIRRSLLVTIRKVGQRLLKCCCIHPEMETDLSERELLSAVQDIDGLLDQSLSLVGLIEQLV